MVIEIPGEPTFRRPVVPPQRIPLPLEIGFRFGLAAGTLIIAGGLIGALMLFGASMMFVATPAMPALQGAGIVIYGLVMTTAGVCFTGAALTALVDRMRSHPVLVLDVDGFRDGRSLRHPIPWSGVVRAKMTYHHRRTRTGIFGVHLTLRHAIEARHNPFRIGTLGFHWRRRADELYVPLLGLTARPHAVAHTIMVLVTCHGGTAEI